MKDNPDYMFKICVVGEDDVGRFSILRSYLKEAITELDYFTTLESNFAVKDVEFIPEHSMTSVMLRIYFWYSTEFMGTSIKNPDLSQFFRQASGVLLVFDLTRPETLEAIPGWIETVFELVGPLIPIMLIGNKSDLQVAVDATEVERISEKFGVPYFYTSAKLNQGIDEVIDSLISLAYEYRTTRE